MKKILFLTALIGLMSSLSFAQTTASATNEIWLYGTPTVVIHQNQNFGWCAVPSSGSATYTMSYVGAVSNSGGAQSATISTTSAMFEVGKNGGKEPVEITVTLTGADAGGVTYALKGGNTVGLTSPSAAAAGHGWTTFSDVTLTGGKYTIAASANAADKYYGLAVGGTVTVPSGATGSGQTTLKGIQVDVATTP